VEWHECSELSDRILQRQPVIDILGDTRPPALRRRTPDIRHEFTPDTHRHFLLDDDTGQGYILISLEVGMSLLDIATAIAMAIQALLGLIK
jgi:hypothetical protein